MTNVSIATEIAIFEQYKHKQLTFEQLMEKYHVTRRQMYKILGVICREEDKK